MSGVINALFQNVITLSLVGSYVILVVLLARLLLWKAPRWCSYLLWGIVFLRLCCPVYPEADFSLIPAWLSTSQNQILEDAGIQSGVKNLHAKASLNGRDDLEDAVNRENVHNQKAAANGEPITGNQSGNARLDTENQSLDTIEDQGSIDTANVMHSENQQ